MNATANLEINETRIISAKPLYMQNYGKKLNKLTFEKSTFCAKILKIDYCASVRGSAALSSLSAPSPRMSTALSSLSARERMFLH